MLAIQQQQNLKSASEEIVLNSNHRLSQLIHSFGPGN